MAITLQVYGREMTFSEDELTAIVEKHFDSTVETKIKTIEFAPTPTEDKWFKVNPMTIDRNLFKDKRKLSQRDTRQLILEAFAEVDANPEKYAKEFKTMMPKNTWNSKGKTVKELEILANKLGNHMADWVEQALEWAQRIANGESWETICNNADTANWFRLVIWEGGHIRLIGGSHKCRSSCPASDMGYCYDSDSVMTDAVPLIVAYD